MYMYICIYNQKGIVISAFGEHHIPPTTVPILSDSHGCTCEGETRNLFGQVMTEILEQTLKSLNS